MAMRVGGPRRKTRRTYKKDVRTRGKLKLSRYFAVFAPGDKVCLNTEPSVQGGMYHSRYHGRVCTVQGKQGACYVLELLDGNVKKQLIIHPVHLQKVL